MYIVVFITAKDAGQADQIAARLVRDKLVACANIIDGVRSVFRWQGKVDKADETLLILKSEKRCFKDIVKAVKSVHSYDVPEIIALPVVDGSEAYLDWVTESCSA